MTGDRQCSCHAVAEDLARQVRDLLAALEWVRTPESERDAATVAAIAQFMGAAEFTTADLCDLVRQSERTGSRALRLALTSQHAMSARALGKFLARVEGQLLDGRVVEATGHDRNRVVWRVLLVSDAHSARKLTNALSLVDAPPA